MPISLTDIFAGTRASIGQKLRCGTLVGLCLSASVAVAQQKAWFVDGYHGGIYGHYPASFTQFMVDSLGSNPDWKLNLEIEPVTWDFARTNTPEAYAALKHLAADQSGSGRIEFINPAYGQSYFWNTSGESIIQQFAFGLNKIQEHFPNAQIFTYSSEEPCFTSALPGILKSFGFHYAVLKNPNTCWGGYTRAFGGELVNWIGPDGTSIVTVPRYAVESLKPNSTWETIASANHPDYVRAAFRDGIEHPVGMCIQDAGWQHGPWLKHVKEVYQPSEATTWRNYFENIATPRPTQDWHFRQEDLQVSLVWGAQVLQRIAQQTRRAENQIVMAEKMATLAGVYRQSAWPEASVNEAWSTLMLAQHHDCWIVPYNGKTNDTWADKVAKWTEKTVFNGEGVLTESARALAGRPDLNEPFHLRVFNTLGAARTDVARVILPKNWSGQPLVRDDAGNEVPSQVVGTEDKGSELIFLAPVPSLGFATFSVQTTNKLQHPLTTAFMGSNGQTIVETDIYRMELDPVRGGTIRSLVLKEHGNRELVDSANTRSFNELRGSFYKAGDCFSTADHPARVEIVENGPVRVKVRVRGQIASNAVTQVITLTRGIRRIDVATRIEWNGSPRIGDDYEQLGEYQHTSNRKAFYDDRYKLLALFPVNFNGRKVFKNAPFDVTESLLTNTFFNTWSDIKNNVLLNWVDAYDPEKQVGLALLSDHTTSYTHGSDHPLGLTVQYSGVGLWGRNYSLHGRTEINYGLVPHVGNWEQASLSIENDRWNEPLHTELCKPGARSGSAKKSLLSIDGAGWEIPAMRMKKGKVYVRLFNASTKASQGNLSYDGPVTKIEMVELDGRIIRGIPFTKNESGRFHFNLLLPRFGVGTLRITE